LNDVASGVRVLSLLPSAPAVDDKLVCGKVSGLLKKEGSSKSGANHDRVAAALRVYGLLKCDDKAVNVVSLIQSALESSSQSTTASTYIDSIKAASTLSAAQVGTIGSIESHIKTLVSLLKSDDAYTAGLAVEVAGDIYPLLKANLQDSVGNALAKVVANLDDASESWGVSKSSIISLGDGLPTTAKYLYGLLKASSHVNFPLSQLSAKRIASLTEFVVLSRHVVSVRDAELVVQSLSAASSNSVAVPLFIGASPLHFVTDASSKLLKVSVTNALGESVAFTGAKIVQVNAENSKKAIATTINIEDGAGADIVKAVRGATGTYDVEIKATVSGVVYSAFDSNTVKVKVLSPAVSPALIKKVSVMASTGGNEEITFPKKASKKLSLDSGSSIGITIYLTSPAHQVFVRFHNKVHNVEAVVYAKLSEDSTSTYEASINVGKFENNAFQYKSGDYTISVIIGDASISEGAAWTVADASIKLSAEPPAVQYKLYQKPLLYESDVSLKPMPVIDHQFRAPAHRPAQIISFLFAGAVGLPLLFLIYAFYAIGINFSNIPGGLGLIFALGFHVAIGATIAVIVTYWFQLTILVALSYLSVTVTAAAFFGYFMLRAHSFDETGSKLKKD
jgi:hypothetical protein